MITFENCLVDEQLQVHTDINGLQELIDELQILLTSAKRSGDDHIHLFTEDWGGSELDNEVQGVGNHLFHHVKIFCWHSPHGDRQ